MMNSLALTIEMPITLEIQVKWLINQTLNSTNFLELIACMHLRGKTTFPDLTDNYGLPLPGPGHDSSVGCGIGIWGVLEREFERTDFAPDNLRVVNDFSYERDVVDCHLVIDRVRLKLNTEYPRWYNLVGASIAAALVWRPNSGIRDLIK